MSLSPACSGYPGAADCARACCPRSNSMPIAAQYPVFAIRPAVPNVSLPDLRIVSPLCNFTLLWERTGPTGRACSPGKPQYTGQIDFRSTQILAQSAFQQLGDMRLASKLI